MKPLALGTGLLVTVMAVAAVIYTALFSGDWRDNVRDPNSITVQEATALLEQAHQASAQRDLESFCEIGGSQLSCQAAWRNSGEWDSAPVVKPTVISTSILPERERDNGNVSRGGRLLKVHGTDNCGDSFVTDFLVFDEGGGKLVALNPVFWTGVHIVVSNADGTYVASAGASTQRRPGDPATVQGTCAERHRT